MAQHGSIIGDLHHLLDLDSLRPMARGPADGVHPRSEGRPLQPSIEAKAELRVELRVEIGLSLPTSLRAHQAASASLNCTGISTTGKLA